MRQYADNTIVNALRVAAVQYATDAATARQAPNHERIVDAFDRQSVEANELADDIEERGLTGGIERWQRR
jgi:hypothetical protein